MHSGVPGRLVTVIATDRRAVGRESYFLFGNNWRAVGVEAGGGLDGSSWLSAVFAGCAALAVAKVAAVA
jgi:hypothetical protein